MGNFTRRLATPHTAPLTAAEVKAGNAYLDQLEIDRVLEKVREAARMERLRDQVHEDTVRNAEDFIRADRAVKAARMPEPPEPLRVYLDDERPTPVGWVGCRWPHEVIDLLKTGKVVELDLDWWLDDLHHTGMEVIEWLENAVRNEHFRPLPMVRAHSSDREKRYEMHTRIRDLRQYVWQTDNNTAQNGSSDECNPAC